MNRSGLTAALVALCLAVAAAPADAQFKKLKDRLKRAAEQEVTRKAEQETRKAVRCALGDQACIDKAKADGAEVEVVDEQGAVVTDADPAEAPGTGVWRNYDFVPGRDVWFASDFSDERIGRFPAGQFEYVSGNMQIVEKDGANVLEVVSDGVFRVVFDEELPEDFTLEFAIAVPANNIMTNVYFTPLDTAHSKHESQYLSVHAKPGVYFKGKALSVTQMHPIVGAMTPIRFQADGDYVIAYAGSERISNVPNATIVRSNAIEFRARANARFRTYISDIVVAVGLDRLYDSLMESGSYTTRGILFDFDSDRLRPESTPVLEEIRRTLAKHDELRLVIEGHTDSAGADDYNLALSERRAAAVVDWLLGQGIDGERLSSTGRGEADPVADNGTPAGQAQNRRVVIRRVE